MKINSIGYSQQYQKKYYSNFSKNFRGNGTVLNTSFEESINQQGGRAALVGQAGFSNEFKYDSQKNVKFLNQEAGKGNTNISFGSFSGNLKNGILSLLTGAVTFISAGCSNPKYINIPSPDIAKTIHVDSAFNNFNGKKFYGCRFIEAFKDCWVERYKQGQYVLVQQYKLFPDVIKNIFARTHLKEDLLLMNMKAGEPLSPEAFEIEFNKIVKNYDNLYAKRKEVDGDMITVVIKREIPENSVNEMIKTISKESEKSEPVINVSEEWNSNLDKTFTVTNAKGKDVTSDFDIYVKY